MPVDASIYSQIQTPDFLGSIEKGMRMGDLIKDRREKSALRDAYKAGVVTNPDGTTRIDQAKTMSALAGVNPEKAQEYQRGMKADQLTDFKLNMEKAGYIGQSLGAANDQPSYELVRNDLISQGLVDEKTMPPVFDPQHRDFMRSKAMSIQDQYAKQWQESEAQRDQKNKDRTFKNQEEELKIKRTEASGKKQTGVATAAADLRKERSGLPTTRATQEISAAYNKIQTAAKNPSPAGDLSLIFGYMKMLDPGSTVREGEFANAQNAAGIPVRVLNAYNAALKGTRLADEQRNDFIGQAGGLYQSQMDIQRQVDSQFSDYATRAGVSPGDVILNFEANQPVRRQAGGGRGGMNVPGIDSANANQRSAPIYKTNEIDWAD